MRPKPRSWNYQHIFTEIFVEQSIYDSYIDEGDDSQEYLELQDELFNRYRELLKAHLSPKMFEIVTLLCSGKTQVEVGKELGYSQPSIQKMVAANHPEIAALKAAATNDPELKAIKAAMRGSVE